MAGISASIRAAVLGSALTAPVLAQEALLPSNPDLKQPPARGAAPDNESAISGPKIWTPTLVAQEAAILRSAIELVDGYFQNQKSDSRGPAWSKARIGILEFVDACEKALEGQIDPAQLKTLGLGLGAQKLSIAALFPPVDGGSTVTTGPSRDGRQDVPIFGTFDVAQFESMKLGARIYGPMLREYLTRDGRELAASDKVLLDAVQSIENASNPAELARDLSPTLPQLEGAISNLLKSDGSAPQGPLKELLGQLNLITRPAPAEPGLIAEGDLKWHQDWMALVNADKVIRLHPAGKEYHDQLKFESLTATPHGYNQLIADVETLLNFFNERLKNPEFSGDRRTIRLRNALNSIIDAGSAEKLPADCLATMKEATEIYRTRQK